MPRRDARLRRREVFDLVVDDDVAGTVADGDAGTCVVEKSFLGEVFVDGRGAVRWRSRVPLEVSPSLREKSLGPEGA